MGQKSNTITIRTNLRKNLSFLNQIQDARIFQCGLKYLNSVDTLLSKKNIIVIEKELNLVGNLIILDFTLFYDNAKLSGYKKRAQKTRMKLKEWNMNSRKIISLFNHKFLLFRSNLVLINLKVLNSQVDKSLVKNFYLKTSKFVNVLFQRKFNLFIDFLKISVLFQQNKIQMLVFLNVLGRIFKVLPKKKHNRFLFFVKNIFQNFMVDSSQNNFLESKNKIEGVKFIVSGKLQGKTRGSSSCIQLGAVPIQTIEKKIEFSKLHVHTLYGVFGFKVWVYRN